MNKGDPQSYTESIGRVIAQLRDKRSLNQKEVAKLVGITYQHLSDIERGAGVRYMMATVERIAQVLGLDFVELLLMARGKSEQANIPIVGYANSADPKQAILYSEAGLPAVEPIDKLRVSGEMADPNAYGLIVKDNSMGFVGRDWILIVSPQMTVGHLDPVVVVYKNKVLFRQVEIGAESYKFCSLVDPNNPLIVPKSEKVIIHKIWQFQSPW